MVLWHKCDMCRAEFSSLSSLSDHKKTRHGAPVVEALGTDPKVAWRLTENDKTMLKKMWITPE